MALLFNFRAEVIAANRSHSFSDIVFLSPLKIRYGGKTENEGVGGGRGGGNKNEMFFFFFLLYLA